MKQHVETDKQVLNVTRKNKSEEAAKHFWLHWQNQPSRVVPQANLKWIMHNVSFNRIPLHKIPHLSEAKFFETYTKNTVPSEFTHRNNCLPKIYDDCVENMKQIASDRYIWTLVDETSEQRSIVNFVCVLGEEEQHEIICLHQMY